MEIAGETLRALLVEISNRLNQSGVDLGPICSRTNDIKPAYDVFVNDIAASMIDVFVGGKRLRKGTPLEPINKLKDTNYYQYNATIDQDSPDADEILDPEYTVENVLIESESRTTIQSAFGSSLAC